MYYVEYYDHESSYPTLTDACRACVREMKRHDYYMSLDIYADRTTRRPSGYVQRGERGFYYFSFAKGKKVVYRLNDKGVRI